MPLKNTYIAFDDYSDDSTIPDDAELWRRIIPWHFGQR
jgi:hypothetical protein